MKSQNAILFMPDISGFTRFVNATEINHSQHIIEELIEVLLQANEIDLKVSEIEGDAVLYFRLGNPPVPEEIARQCRSFFLNFHNYINQIEKDSVCHCGACSTVSELTLKFFLHYGELGISNIREHTKIVGKDVILIHRLMKNNIDSNEYLMMSRAYTQFYSEQEIAAAFNWGKVTRGRILYEHFGEVDYSFVEMSSLLAELLPLAPLEDAVKYKDPIEVSAFIDSPPEDVYTIVIDLSRRPEWSEGLKNIIYDKKKIQRIGMRHKCEFRRNTLVVEIIQSSVRGGEIEYAEKALKNFFFPGATTFFIFSKEDQGTRLTVHFHYKRLLLVGRFFDMIFRKRLAADIEKSLQRLKNYCTNRKKSGQSKK